LTHTRSPSTLNNHLGKPQENKKKKKKKKKKKTYSYEYGEGKRFSSCRCYRWHGCNNIIVHDTYIFMATTIPSHGCKRFGGFIPFGYLSRYEEGGGMVMMVGSLSLCHRLLP